MDSNKKPEPPAPDWVWAIGYIIGLGFLAGLSLALLFLAFDLVGII